MYQAHGVEPEGAIVMTFGSHLPIVQSVIAGEEMYAGASMRCADNFGHDLGPAQFLGDYLTIVNDTINVATIAAGGLDFAGDGLTFSPVTADLAVESKLITADNMAADAALSRSPIPGDADFVGPVAGDSWTLSPNGMGAHLVERVNVRGRAGLAALDQPGTPTFFPYGTPEAAGAAHLQLHEATSAGGISLPGQAE